MTWQTSYHPLLAIPRPSIHPCKEKEKKKTTAPNPTSLSHLSSLPSARRLPLSVPDPDRRCHPSSQPLPHPSLPVIGGGALLPSRCTRTSLPLPALLPPPPQLGFRLPDPQSPKLGSSSSSDGGRGRSSPRSSLLAALAGGCLRGDDGGLVVPGGRGAPQGRPGTLGARAADAGHAQIAAGHERVTRGRAGPWGRGGGVGSGQARCRGVPHGRARLPQHPDLNEPTGRRPCPARGARGGGAHLDSHKGPALYHHVIGLLQHRVQHVSVSAGAACWSRPSSTSTWSRAWTGSSALTSAKTPSGH